MNTLITRTLSGAVYVVSLIGSLWFNLSLFFVVIAIYAGLVLAEFVTLVRLACLQKGCSRARFLLSLLFGSLLWIIFPFFLMGLMSIAPFSDYQGGAVSLTIAMFVLTWGHDSFAYLTGRWLGRRKLIPGISPAKTVEGAIGGALITILLAVALLHHLIPGFTVWFWLGGALLVTVGANFGDMAESMLKRRAGVKDSGRLMPGHGGLFDRFDALLVVAPLWYCWINLFA